MNQAYQILRLPQVLNLTGLSRSTIYGMIQKNAFPKQVALGARSVGWRSQDLQDWLASRPQAS